MTQSQKGFTLVELAISLMIIGLLIGGVLKGDELVKNARVVQTVKVINDYRGAVASFRSVYDGWPGDIYNPGTRIPNCTGTCAQGLWAGDLMNNLIGTPINLNAQVISGYPTYEGSSFWYQLMTAGFITDKRSTRKTGGTYMTTPFGGSTLIFATSYIDTNVYGNYFGLGPLGTASSYIVAPYGGNGVIPPARAQSIDAKMDDGLPNTGDVIIPANGTDCADAGVYVTTVTYNSCSLLFKASK